MTHSKRQLPKNILERSDAETIEIILGKRVKRGLDEVAQAFENKPITKSMKQRYQDNDIASSR